MTTASEVLNTRTGVGAGIGAIIGFAFGGPVGAGAGALLGGTIAHASGEPEPRGEITPKRKMIYARAMEKVSEPVELEKLADAFAGEGLDGYAEMLRKRANLRKLPDQVQAKRRAAFRKAMASDNPDAIAQIAGAFEQVGSIDAAKVLREHADAVKAAHAAGKSAKPMTGGTVAQFADKLGKAIIHFGPASGQAKMAAKNLIQARGKTPSDDLIVEVIKIAATALNVQSPGAEGAAPSAAQAPSPETIAQAQAAVAEAAPTGAPEPTVMGPPAAPVEKPVVAGGVAVARGPAVAAPVQSVEDAVEEGAAAEEGLAAEAAAAGAPPARPSSEVAASADAEGAIMETEEVIPPPDISVPAIPPGEAEMR